ncbi:glycoside hydrolase family 3 N-terminal domain-containing protein [Neobacillus novalis]|uniref:glycoside hydrolase family 3 N-terminal domain-containing protein n=1 Tax=Neobacillus novalis TaxID=220687 RepID=UPI00082598F0|nr:glycoside hydrolase family 3 N-terminal domain-containing protein [Neobacillus novalis]
MRKYKRGIAIFTIAVMMSYVLQGFFSPLTANAASVSGDPIYLDENQPINVRVADLLSKMTTDEKLGQMIQAEKASITPAQVKQYNIGSVLSGGGSFPNGKQADSLPDNWKKLVDGYQDAALGTRLGIPIIYGVDAVHGNNNVIGATIFPHNIGLGAANNVALTKEIGAASAAEIKATGIHWDFAPTTATAQDIKWGRTYEAFSDNANISAQLGAAYIKGLQGENPSADLAKNNTVVATAKHFIGEGYTDNGKNKGNISSLTEDEILAKELNIYKQAVDAGVRTVMASYHSIQGLKMHANKRLLTDVLKGELGFDGYVITDYNGVDQISVDQDGNPVSGLKNQLKTAVNAGVDMFMQPQNWQTALGHLKTLAADGDIKMDRIDDAVSRILKVKFEAGLFKNPKTDPSLAKEFGSKEHKKIARQAVGESLVLLKNDVVNGSPIMSQLSKMNKVFVAGSSADDIGMQSGGWTISWQGSAGKTTPGTTILDGIKEKVGADKVTYNKHGRGAAGHDVAIVVIGENPYAESNGDTSEIKLSFEQEQTIQNIRNADQDIPIVVILVSGRPMIITDELKDWAGVVAAWLPGTEGGGVADILFNDSNDFKGKLPIRWPFFMEAYPSFYGEQSENFLFNTGYGLVKGEQTPNLPEPPEKPTVEGHAIPGKIEAEDWLTQSGVDTEQTQDEGGGLNVGWADPGDWIDYQVNVNEPGSYNIDVRYAANEKTGLKFINEKGKNIGEMSVSSTGGYQSWKTFTIKNVVLEKGNQKLRVSYTGGALNLNWYQFTRTGDIPADYNPNPDPPALPEDDVAAVVKDNAVENWVTVARDSQNMGWYYNSRWQEGDPKLEKQENINIMQQVDESSVNTFHIDPTQKFQSIMGIGSSVDEATIYNMSKMSEEKRYELLKQLIDPVEGVGMSMMRLTMGTSDFTAREFYSYDDMPAGKTDEKLEHFSIEKDRQFHIIDTVKQMKEINPAIKFFASPWSPPGWMKTSDSMIKGSLKEGYEEILAEYYLKYFQAYRAEGIEIEAMTLQNEPLLEIDYPSMHLPWKQAVKVSKHLREKLDANGFKHVKLWMFDHNPSDAQAYAANFLKDADGYAAVEGTAFHDYGGDLSEMTKLQKQFPDKNVYLTERSVWGTNGADRIAQYFRNYARSYNSWVVMLDSDISTHQWVGTPDPTTIVQDSANPDNYWLTPEYYISGHYSKFVKPDYIRIGSDYGSADTVTNVSFMSPDQKEIVTVVTNQTKQAQKFKLVSEGTQFIATLPANSVATYRWDRLDAHKVPGKMKAIDYDQAEGSFTTKDGYIGEINKQSEVTKLDYLLNVNEAGDYYVDFGFAGYKEKPQLDLAINGELAGTINLQSTGWWENWAKKRIQLHLNKGIQRLTITAHETDYNFNDITFTKITNDIHTIPGRIQAEEFTDASGILVQDLDKGLSVGYLDPGDWLDYQINVNESGTYKVTYRYASGNPNPSLEWIVDGHSIHTAALNSTGGWDTYKLANDEITLTAGNHVLRLQVREGMNIDWISVGTTLSLEKSTITEGAEDGHIVDVFVENDTFVNELDINEWKLNGPKGTTISKVERISDNHVKVTLSGNRTVDYDTDIIAKLTVSQNQFEGWAKSGSTAAFDISETVVFKAIDDIESITVEPKTQQAGDGELTVTISGGTFTEEAVQQISLTGKAVTNGNIVLSEVIYNSPTKVTIKYSQDDRPIYEDVTLTVNVPVEAYDDSTNGTTLSDTFILLGTTNQEEATAIPGEINLEKDFYKLSGVSFANGPSDTRKITDVQSGDWIEYVIDVPKDGQYVLTLGVVTNSDVGEGIVFKSENGDTLAAFTIPNIWGAWSEVKQTVSLPSGKQKIRVFAANGGFELNKIKFEKLQALHSDEDVIKVEAEDYYNASQAIIQPGSTRTNIGYTTANGWIDYLINVPPGNYKVTYHYSTTEGGVGARASVGNNQVTTNLTSTGDWGAYQNASSGNTLYIPKGDQTVRMEVLVNGFNLDWFELEMVDPENPGPTDPGPTDPGPTDPGPTDPGPTDPGPTDPGPTDPGPTDPGTTDPGTTDPGTTDPGTSPGTDLGNGTQSGNGQDHEDKLPNTATSMFNNILAGLVFFLIGGFLYTRNRRNTANK